jgi:hypothetical protein
MQKKNMHYTQCLMSIRTRYMCAYACLFPPVCTGIYEKWVKQKYTGMSTHAQQYCIFVYACKRISSKQWCGYESTRAVSSSVWKCLKAGYNYQWWCVHVKMIINNILFPTTGWKGDGLRTGVHVLGCCILLCGVWCRWSPAKVCMYTHKCLYPMPVYASCVGHVYIHTCRSPVHTHV